MESVDGLPINPVGFGICMDINPEDFKVSNAFGLLGADVFDFFLRKNNQHPNPHGFIFFLFFLWQEKTSCVFFGGEVREGYIYIDTLLEEPAGKIVGQKVSLCIYIYMFIHLFIYIYIHKASKLHTFT